jgi:hypothetical protein
MMSRPVAGLACRIRVPVRQYQAVALVVRGNSNVVRLMHRDVGLSLDIESFDNLATAEEYRDRLAGFLDLPPLIVSATPDAERGEESVPRERRSRGVRTRRPRFLMRRRAGGQLTLRKIEGREIIARD